MDTSRRSLVVSEDVITATCGETPIPELGLVEQVWKTDPVTDTRTEAAAAFDGLPTDHLDAGATVALGVGSRGIANLSAIVSGVVEGARDEGFQPFVFPAMGSHGGATAEGQLEMLDELGVSETSVGCEIRSSMEVVDVGRSAERDVPVVTDAQAAAADAIVPINRIKPHTDYDGPIESGVSKMLVIGMGKQRGAKIAHDWSVSWSLREMVPEITEQLLETLPVVGGIAILEDQHDDTAMIEPLPPEEFLSRERELLDLAYDLMPTLPFDDLDVLVVDRQGKDISGQGMDTNVIGRRPFAIQEPEPETPDIKRIYTRGLTATTHGNAMGMGSADFVHADLLEAVDAQTSLINALTACTTRGVRIPPVVETDRAGLVACLSTIGIVGPDEVRLLRIADTMHLDRLYASRALIEEARDRDDLRVLEEPEPIEFDGGAFTRTSPDEVPVRTRSD